MDGYTFLLSYFTPLIYGIYLLFYGVIYLKTNDTKLLYQALLCAFPLNFNIYQKSILLGDIYIVWFICWGTFYACTALAIWAEMWGIQVVD